MCFSETSLGVDKLQPLFHWLRSSVVQEEQQRLWIQKGKTSGPILQSIVLTNQLTSYLESKSKPIPSHRWVGGILGPLFFLFVKVAIKVKNLIFVIECIQQYTY